MGGALGWLGTMWSLSVIDKDGEDVKRLIRSFASIARKENFWWHKRQFKNLPWYQLDHIFWVKFPWAIPWVKFLWVKFLWVKFPWVKFPWVKFPWVKFLWVKFPWVKFPWVGFLLGQISLGQISFGLKFLWDQIPLVPNYFGRDFLLVKFLFWVYFPTSQD